MNEPAKIIESTTMNYRQWIVIALMVILNALDGFDVLSSAFASPGMTREWGIERSALGVVLSAELVGMGVGSVILGGLADKHGRKNAMLVCLVMMSIGMYLASLANGVTPMIICRFVTGIGIGGMLAATNAVTAESSNLKYRSIRSKFSDVAKRDAKAVAILSKIFSSRRCSMVLLATMSCIYLLFKLSLSCVNCLLRSSSCRCLCCSLYIFLACACIVLLTMSCTPSFNISWWIQTRTTPSTSCARFTESTSL